MLARSKTKALSGASFNNNVSRNVEICEKQVGQKSILSIYCVELCIRQVSALSSATLPSYHLSRLFSTRSGHASPMCTTTPYNALYLRRKQVVVSLLPCFEVAPVHLLHGMEQEKQQTEGRGHNNLNTVSQKKEQQQHLWRRNGAQHSRKQQQPGSAPAHPKAGVTDICRQSSAWRKYSGCCHTEHSRYILVGTSSLGLPQTRFNAFKLLPISIMTTVAADTWEMRVTRNAVGTHSSTE